MLVAGVFFLLLTGGNSSSLELPDLLDDPQASNQSITEMPGGNASSSEPPELLDDPQASNRSTEETPEARTEVCTYQDVLNFLNLTRNNDLFTMSRPVKNHSSLTDVYLEMVVSAILDVKETDQTFVSHIWLYMSWQNEHIEWDPEDFCGLEHVIVPTQVLWQPDVIIEEMIEKDKTSPSPYLKINSMGYVEYRNDQVVIGACKMDVYKFPFDIQRCNISFKSLLHSDKEIHFEVNQNTTVVTKWSRRVMQTQYEWLFIKMTVSNKSDDFYFYDNQTAIVYTIFMKRRSVLYVANFLLPVFFLLCLDLASFLMPDSGGEKIGFKVTVLLAVTVMQLILKDILPCSSDRMPLIAVYCIGIFALILVSLLETILAMHLLEKDSQDNKTDTDPSLSRNKVAHSCFREMKRCASCASLWDDQTPTVTKKGGRRQPTEVSLTLGKVSDELEEIEKTISLLSGKKEEEKSGYWARVVKKMNRVFITLYLPAATLFLAIIFSLWTRSEEGL